MLGSEIDSLRRSETNLEVLEGLLGRLSEQIAERSMIKAGEPVAVGVKTSENSWIAEQSLTSVLKSVGARVFAVPIHQAGITDTQLTAHMLISAEVTVMRVRYDGMYREGMFGPKKVTRTATTSISYQTVNSATNEVQSSETLTASAVDTILVDAVPALEQSGIAGTHAIVPDDGFLDRFFEPIVIMGTIGIAVYLFFHIRS